MAKYVYVYQGGGMAPTEEEQQAAMAAWGAWLGGMGDSLVDMGQPFGPSAAVKADGSNGAVKTTFHYDGKDYPVTGSPDFDTISARRIDAGTIETPSSAATSVMIEAMCGATWPITGSKPALRHAPMTLS